MSYSGSVPDTAGRPLDWMDRMACRNKRELFDDPKQDYEARTECITHCPVRSQCLAHVKQLEAGASRIQRDGVVAGLTHKERWRCDTEAYRGQDDTPAFAFDGTERCGTHIALIRHLWLNEPIDPKCWTAIAYRSRSSRSLPRKRGDATKAAS